ncbi:LCP family protein [Candidatus Peribacteria bacterium]|nr:LCP family protein [Candidatus Peribacteria bacterium]
MDFQMRPLRSEEEKSSPSFFRRWKWAGVLVLGLLAFGAYAAHRTYNNKSLVPALPGRAPQFALERDVNGHTNMLLLGTGGEQAEGGNLTDSIMIVSIDPEAPTVSVVSIPRDLFVISPAGNRKINELYAAIRYQHLLENLEVYGKNFTREERTAAADKAADDTLPELRKALETPLGIELHYAVVVDYELFSDIIDALDGVDVYVTQTLHDTQYPAPNYQYQTFHIDAGQQHLDGQMALMYARSRSTTSDFDRARRQQDILIALRKKAMSHKVLTDVGTLSDLWGSFRARIHTDLPLSALLALAKIGAGIDMDTVTSAVLSNDDTARGGILYTPDSRDYGGQFVLRPYQSGLLQQFLQLNLLHPEALLERAHISVHNGTKEPGKAGELAAELQLLGFQVVEVGNYRPEDTAQDSSSKSTVGAAELPYTLVFSVSEKPVPETLNYLSKEMGLPVVQEARAREALGPHASQVTPSEEPDGMVDIQVLLGKDDPADDDGSVLVPSVRR